MDSPRRQLAKIMAREPQDYPVVVDPDDTYDESTNPSNGWRAPEVHEAIDPRAELDAAQANLAYIEQHQADARSTLPYYQTQSGLEYLATRLLRSEGLRHWDITPELVKARALTIREENKPRPLELTLNLEDAPSGGAPQVLFPALRISTVSRVIYPNQAMLGAWRAYFSGTLPRYFKFQLDLDNYVVVLTPALVYSRGMYKLTLGSETGFGPSIGFGQPLHKLMGVMEDLSIPDYAERRQAAADRIFGRRRVYSLPNGQWAIRLTDPLV